MKSRILYLISLIIYLLVLSLGKAYAEEEKLSRGITLQSGLLKPSLEMISDGAINSVSESGSSDYVTSGEISPIASFSIGLIARNAAGFASRLAYQYQQESEMVYTKSSTDDSEVVFDEEEQPKFTYSMHILSLALMKHIRLVPSNLSIYLGGGIAGTLLLYPEQNNGEDHSIGITGFPLAGLEYMIGPHIGLFGEFQYHFGRTLEQHYSVEDGSDVQIIDYHYSLKGAHLLGGLNLFF